MARATNIRPATSADATRIAEIISGQPGPEAIRLSGDIETARARGMRAVELERQRLPQTTVVAEIDEEVVGLLRYERAPKPHGLFERGWHAFRVHGVGGALRSGTRIWARSRVALEPPSDAFHICELDVAPEYRNNGIGADLLDWAEAEAVARGHPCLSLATHLANPARHLYERKGFVIRHVTYDKRYERVTGIPGRVLLVKPLG